LKAVQITNSENDVLSIPVQLRGQVIGRLKLNAADPSRQWTDDEMIMMSATAERVALALEGARLLDEAQKRATREAFLSEVATKLSTSFQLDSILRDTVQELGQTLKNSTVTFQLVNPTASPVINEPQKSNGAKAE
jgi:GAF domain-containing protein